MSDKKPARSPEAEAVLEIPFTQRDIEKAREYLGRFECATTALYVIGAILGEEDDDGAAEIIAEAVEKLAEHEGPRR